MILVRLETKDGQFVGNVEILPEATAPQIVAWGNRFFTLHQLVPKLIYREARVTISLTSGERCMELSQI